MGLGPDKKKKFYLKVSLIFVFFKKKKLIDGMKINITNGSRKSKRSEKFSVYDFGDTNY
jgi:hypothetical protein